jgi:hypothetical protein
MIKILLFGAAVAVGAKQAKKRKVTQTPALAGSFVSASLIQYATQQNSNFSAAKLRLALGKPLFPPYAPTNCQRPSKHTKFFLPKSSS